MFGTPGSALVPVRFAGAVLAALLVITTPARAASAVTMAPRPAAAQNTGTISGTVIDNTSQVVPGATVTLTNESTASARTTVSGERGEFAFRAVDAGSYTVRVELAGFRTTEQRNNVLNASGQLDLGSFKLDVGTVTRGGLGRRRRQHDRDEEQRLLGAADGEADRADPEPGPRRRQPAPAAARRALRERHRGDGRQLRIADPEHRRPAQELESGHRRRVERQRALGHQPHELLDQSRCDRRGQGAAEHLQGGVRPHAAAPTSRSSARAAAPTITAARYWYGKRDAWNATPWENNRTGIAKPKLHIDTPGFNLGGPVKIPGRLRSERRQEAVLLLLVRGAAGAAARAAAPLPDADRARAPGRLLADVRHQRRPDLHQGSGSSTAACSVDDRRRRVLSRQHHPGQPARRNALALLNLLPLPNAARRRARTTTSPGRKRRQPALQQPAAGRRAAVAGSNASGRQCRHVLLEPVRIGDHRRPGEVGLLQRLLRVRRQRRSTAAGTTSPRSNRVNELQIGMRRATEGVRYQDRRRPEAHPEVDRRLHPAAVQSGAEHARRDPAASRSGWRPPASTVRTSPTTAASDRPRTTGSASVRDNLTLDARHATPSSSAAISSTCRTTRRAAATGRAIPVQQQRRPIRSTRTSPSRTRCSACSRSTPRPTSTG